MTSGSVLFYVATFPGLTLFGPNLFWLMLDDFTPVVAR